MKSKKAKSKRKLFDPDIILTKIHQAIRLDFPNTLHEYRAGDSSQHFNEVFVTPQAYVGNRQVNEFLKKYSSPNVDQSPLEDAAINKFLMVNTHMGEFNRPVMVDKTMRLQRDTPFHNKVMLRARALMHHVLRDFDEDEWFRCAKNSTGTSLGIPYFDTSQERKFTFPMTVTKRAERMFNRYLTFDFELKSAIENFNCGTKMPRYKIVHGSRATTVEKDSTKRRFISVEPTCNMFLQQGLMEMMYQRMAEFGLDVSRLPAEHTRLAWASSITCRNATIDWTSASDCVSIELLKWLLPSKWFNMVDMVRSEFTTVKGKEVRLNMFATMGNATTFPLETLVFWTFGHAVRLSLQRGNSLFPEWEDLNTISVFGDDCIVPTEMAEPFIKVLTDVGFIVNDEKSYYDTMKFRESCGGDYLAGYNVRPYFCKAPHSTKRSSLEPWLYIIMNSLLKKYRSYFGELTYIYDKALFRAFLKLSKQYNLQIKVVPNHYPDDAGFKISDDFIRFCREYPILLNRIYVSKHGTVKFNYLRFQLTENRKRNPHLRYALWLKNPKVAPEVHWHLNANVVEPSPYTKRKRSGGYVVARGYSCQWPLLGMETQDLNMV